MLVPGEKPSLRLMSRGFQRTPSALIGMDPAGMWRRRPVGVAARTV